MKATRIADIIESSNETLPEFTARLMSRITKGGRDECWPWTGEQRRGYGRITCFCSGKRRMLSAHRAAAWLSGIAVDGLLVMHSCDNPSCCNPKHLSAGTDADNARDRDSRGRNRQPSGEMSGKSVLCNKDIVVVWHAYRGGVRQADIARSLGVDPGTIGAIVHGKTWRRVSEGMGVVFSDG
jgi:hypothetical protein